MLLQLSRPATCKEGKECRIPYRIPAGDRARVTTLVLLETSGEDSRNSFAVMMPTILVQPLQSPHHGFVPRWQVGFLQIIRESGTLLRPLRGGPGKYTVVCRSQDLARPWQIARLRIRHDHVQRGNCQQQRAAGQASSRNIKPRCCCPTGYNGTPKPYRQGLPASRDSSFIGERRTCLSRESSDVLARYRYGCEGRSSRSTQQAHRFDIRA